MLCENDIEKIKSALKFERLSHTLGVEKAAIRLAEYCLPHRVCELRAAALLHDIGKGYPAELSLNIMKSLDFITDDDILSPPVYHAFVGPTLVKRHFPEVATDDVLSSIMNHTTGAPDMSVFDEIIFLADYIEDGRTYSSCKMVRNFLYNSLESARNCDEAAMCLHRATVMALDFTIIHVVENGKHLNQRTVATRNAFIGRLPVAID